MNCDRVRDMMHDRIDGVLSDSDDTRLDAHLSSCSACNTVFAQLSDVDAGLAELRMATELPEVSHRWHPSRGRLKRVSRVAAGVVLAIGVGLATRTAMVDRVDPVQPPLQVHAAPRIKLTAESADRYLPIVERTNRPDVTIVWLHPKLTTQPKNEPVPAGDGASLRRAPGETLAVAKPETIPSV